MSTEYGPIQVAPSGLLGFLNLKNSGRNPSELVSSVQPTLDVREWWFNTQADKPQTAFSATISAAAATGFRDFTNPTYIEVPPNQWWYLIDYSLWTSAVAATDRCVLSLAWAQLPALTEVYTFSDRLIIDATTPVGAQPRVSGGSRWLPPLAHVGFWLESFAATSNLTVAGYLRFARLPI